MIKMLWMILFVIMSVTTACVTSHATPTPVISGLAWTAYTDVNGKGFWIYWKDKSNITATYTNVNRTQITNVAQVTVIINTVLLNPRPSDMCFVLTAYNSVGSESGYSNEVCGFTGFIAPAGLVGN